ncbi:MAG: hypothetical protein GY858_01490 [Candidatus Omnitrophica bacterium]|nr:hypothetical protein [Candidatus Omnitrophota bacterium]
MIRKITLRKGSVPFRVIAVFVAVAILAAAIPRLFDRGRLPGLLRLKGKGAISHAHAYNLPSPTKLLPLSQDYSYSVLKGLRFDPENPLNIEFIVDTANQEDINQEEASRLIRYFLAGLTLPEEELWVNLSPYEKTRVAPDDLSLTDLGKDLLGQDYILKQLLSSLTYPESETGKDYWEKVYEDCRDAKLCVSDLSINAFNKVWITPDKSVVYENKDVAYITEATMKVMLEDDYVARGHVPDRTGTCTGSPDVVGDRYVSPEVNEITSRLMRETILPKISHDVNHGKNFARLRQIYHSLILAVWFKEKFKDTFYQHYIDQGKIKGIDLEGKGAKDKIYNLYVEAYKKGVYNYIKPERDPTTHKRINRKYFSGGCNFISLPNNLKVAQNISDAVASGMFSATKAKRIIASGRTVDENRNGSISLESRPRVSGKPRRGDSPQAPGARNGKPKKGKRPLKPPAANHPRGGSVSDSILEVTPDVLLGYMMRNKIFKDKAKTLEGFEREMVAIGHDKGVNNSLQILSDVGMVCEDDSRYYLPDYFKSISARGLWTILDNFPSLKTPQLTKEETAAIKYTFSEHEPLPVHTSAAQVRQYYLDAIKNDPLLSPYFTNAIVNTLGRSVLGVGGYSTIYSLSDDDAIFCKVSGGGYRKEGESILALENKMNMRELRTLVKFNQLDMPGFSQLKKEGAGVDEDGNLQMTEENISGGQQIGKKVIKIEGYQVVDSWFEVGEIFGSFSVVEQIDVFAKVLSFCENVHKQKLVVGDVNPRNIIVNQERRVGMIDPQFVAPIGAMPRRSGMDSFIPSGLRFYPRYPSWDIYSLAKIMGYVFENIPDGYQDDWEADKEKSGLQDLITYMEELYPKHPIDDDMVYVKEQFERVKSYYLIKERIINLEKLREISSERKLDEQEKDYLKKYLIYFKYMYDQEEAVTTSSEDSIDYLIILSRLELKSKGYPNPPTTIKALIDKIGLKSYSHGIMPSVFDFGLIDSVLEKLRESENKDDKRIELGEKLSRKSERLKTNLRNIVDASTFAIFNLTVRLDFPSLVYAIVVDLITQLEEIIDSKEEVINFLQLIKGDLAGSDDKKLDRKLDEMIDTILEVRRRGQGALDALEDLKDAIDDSAEMKIVGVGESLYSALERYRNIYKKVDWQMSRNDSVQMEANAIQLDFIWSNLFDNAAYATRECEQIKDEPYQGEVSASVKQTDNNVIISITDNGIGIFEDKLKDGWIFQEGKTTKGNLGTGIGLSIVKELIDDLGATINVKSRHIEEDSQNHGTTFTIIMPIKEIDGAIADKPTAEDLEDLGIFNNIKSERAWQEAVGLLNKLGVKNGDSITNVGVEGVHFSGYLGLVVSSLGINYVGYGLQRGPHEKSENIAEMFLENPLVRKELKGKIKYVLGEFSAGERSKSKELADHSQDVVITLTGVFSDPAPDSNPEEALREALRVVKSGGKIVAGTYGMKPELERVERLIKRILSQPEYEGIRVGEPNYVNYREGLDFNGYIYEINKTDGSGFSLTNSSSPFVVSNGVENWGSGLPEYMEGFFKLLANQAKEVYSVSLFERSEKWPKNAIFKEIRRVLDIHRYLFKRKQLVREITEKIPKQLSEKPFIPVAYSAGFDLWIQAIEQEKYPVSTIVAIEGVMLNKAKKIIDNPHLRRIISISGELRFPYQIEDRKFHNSKGEEIETVKIVIEGASHWIFNQPEYLKVMSEEIKDQFLKLENEGLPAPADAGRRISGKPWRGDFLQAPGVGNGKPKKGKRPLKPPAAIHSRGGSSRQEEPKGVIIKKRTKDDFAIRRFKRIKGGDDWKEVVSFLNGLGLKSGDSVVDVGIDGTYPLGCLGVVTSTLEIDYIAYSLDPRAHLMSKDAADIFLKKPFFRKELKGEIKHILGEFSAGERSKSKELADHSQDVVMTSTGVLSDLFPVSHPKEVLEEALRVVKPGGKIVAGTYGLSTEFKKVDSLIKELLSQPEYEGVKIERQHYVDCRRSLRFSGYVYEVTFPENNGGVGGIDMLRKNFNLQTEGEGVFVKRAQTSGAPTFSYEGLIFTVTSIEDISSSELTQMLLPVER